MTKISNLTIRKYTQEFTAVDKICDRTIYIWPKTSDYAELKYHLAICNIMSGRNMQQLARRAVVCMQSWHHFRRIFARF